MKKIYSLVTVLLSLVLYNCSEPEISPEVPFEDQQTSALSIYTNSVFAIEVTALKSHPEHSMPEPVEMFLGGSSGVISVNWGDGTIQKMGLQERMELAHQYAVAKSYTIRITGDIKQINEFDVAYQHMAFRYFHLSGLTGLTKFSAQLIESSPETLNFSNNRMIESVRLVGLKSLKEIILPSTNNISDIDISGENRLSTSVVDRVIARVHDSVIAKPRSGSFMLSKSWAQDETSYEMVGPPSSYSLNKLRKLKNSYGWTITPDPR